jgi:hypothetical protein
LTRSPTRSSCLTPQGRASTGLCRFIIKAHKKDEWHGFYLTDPAHHPHYIVEARAQINGYNQGRHRARAGVCHRRYKKRQRRRRSRGSTLLSGGEKLKVEAIEHWLTKLMFECGIRVIYMAKRDKYQGINGGAGVRFFDAFSYPEYNRIGAAPHGTSYFDYPWQDWNGMRENMERRNMHFRYKHRAYFYVPYEQQPYYFNTEELATMWHFPSRLCRRPGWTACPAAALTRLLISLSNTHGSAQVSSPAFPDVYTFWPQKLGLVPLAARCRAHWRLRSWASAYWAGGVYYFTLSPLPYFPSGSYVSVPQGSSLKDVGEILAERGIVRSSWTFRQMARVLGSDTHVPAGVYYFGPAKNIIEVAVQVVSGDFETTPVRVTIPEGSTNNDIAKILYDKIPAFDRDAFLRATEGKEGYLFPDTYFFMPERRHRGHTVGV